MAVFHTVPIVEEELIRKAACFHASGVQVRVDDIEETCTTQGARGQQCTEGKVHGAAVHCMRVWTEPSPFTSPTNIEYGVAALGVGNTELGCFTNVPSPSTLSSR